MSASQLFQRVLFVVIMAMLLAVSAGTIYYAANAPVPETETRAPKDWRPPLYKCPKDVELWDCIRHAMYREDL